MKTECYADNFFRLVGACWRPVFSTSHHGFSLRSLYRKFQVFLQNSLPRSHRHIDVSSFTSLYSIQSERAPALLVIEDTDGSVFGALVSSPIRFALNHQPGFALI